MSYRQRSALRVWLLIVGALALRGVAQELLPPGFRPLPVGIHALTGGTVVVKPGEQLEACTVVIRDGIIKAVGQNITAPTDARVWDCQGLTIYPGFIDAYVVAASNAAPVETTETEPGNRQGLAASGVKFFGAPGAQSDTGKPGPGYEIRTITPEQRIARSYSPDKKLLESFRELGFTAGLFVPAKGTIRGTSALVALSDEDANSAVLKSDVFQHIAFETQQSGDPVFPASLMGVVAAIRQALSDAEHYALDRADYNQHPTGRKRADFDPALEALKPVLDKGMPVAFEPGSALMVDRAAKVAAEFGIHFCVLASGQEWRRPELAAGTKATFIVPLDFPELRKLPDEEDWEQVTLDQLRAWDWAAENPGLLRGNALEVALTTYRLKDKSRFRENLRLAIDRGLAEKDAVAALTTVPAKLCGIEQQLGTIEPGKLANLTVVQGKSYFDPEAKVSAVWIDGRIYRAPLKAKPDKSSQYEQSASSAESAKAEKDKEAPEKRAQPPELTKEKAKTEAASAEEKEAKPAKSKEQRKELRELLKSRLAHSPEEGGGPISEPKAVLVKEASIWTCGAAGVIEKADLLVVGSKIKAVGRGLSERDNDPGRLVINGRGLHVTPGIIDPHSHTAVLGSVNESTLPSTAMVRIQDVINSETDNIYQQLAGGVTTINVLHGSANPIGGQSCVLKLRNGQPPEGLIFKAAPPGIKFALGENVKQSNWGEKFTTRFPQTRMGVRTFIENRFTAAQEYLEEWRKYQTGGVPPRRNLELEALGEVLQGKRWIHAHAYRQDEILMLIRLMDSFGVKIASFEHVLEGYKVADEIATHGAVASTFADWWAYKFEVYDAIAYGGSLMNERETIVSFNSDSAELARRLYAEAAKAIKYGGTPETNALEFITLNPAKQLKVDSLVGSLESGKDADFAIWSKSPLDSETLCLQTWIEGKKYFDRSLEPQRTLKLEQERSQLIAKAKKVQKLGKTGGDSEADSDGGEDESFLKVSLEHQFDAVADRDNDRR